MKFTCHGNENVNNITRYYYYFIQADSELIGNLKFYYICNGYYDFRGFEYV